jgi:DNA-binding response OmpR family regulator
MRLLLVEDDAELADGLCSGLRQSGYAVDWVDNGQQADAALAATGFDLAILDIGLPELDGFSVLQRLRQRRQATLVLILTARDEPEERIRGLDLGADDYLTKPFVLGELEARIRALGRRARGAADALIECGPLTLDRAGQRVRLDGRPLELTRSEFHILACLMERSGKVVSKEFLFERLYDWETQANTSAVEVFVSRLRRKIEGAGVGIRVVRGLGYLLETGKDEH